MQCPPFAECLSDIGAAQSRADPVVVDLREYKKIAGVASATTRCLVWVMTFEHAYTVLSMLRIRSDWCQFLGRTAGKLNLTMRRIVVGIASFGEV